MINIMNIPIKYRTCINCENCEEKRYCCDGYEYYCCEFNHFVDEEEDTCSKWKFNNWQLYGDGVVLWSR